MSTAAEHNANHTPEWNAANDYARAQNYPEAVTHGSAAVAQAIAATRAAYTAGLHDAATSPYINLPGEYLAKLGLQVARMETVGTIEHDVAQAYLAGVHGPTLHTEQD